MVRADLMAEASAARVNHRHHLVLVESPGLGGGFVHHLADGL